MKKRKRGLNQVFKKLSALYELADCSEIASGRAWYRDANSFAIELARRYNMHLYRVCGVISALSPACSWKINKRQAESLIAAYTAGIKLSSVKVSTYGIQKQKAIDILAAESEQEVIAILGKQARKTIAFFLTIYEPGLATNDIVIDRWIMRAVGFDGLSGNSLLAVYSYIAADIRLLAGKLGILPCELQAIIWLTIQRIGEISDEPAPF